MKNDSSDKRKSFGKNDKRFAPDGHEWRIQEKKKPRLEASLWGTHAVQEAWLNPQRRIRRLFITEQMHDAFAPSIEKAAQLGLDRPEPTIMDKKDLDQRLPVGAVHQGIAVDAEPLDEVFVTDLITAVEPGQRAVILMLDQVTDPHNVGAILRSAAAFGATGVIMQSRHSPELTGVLAKTASGAVEHLAVAYEINLSRALDTLQQAGFTALALDERGPEPLSTFDMKDRMVIVLGAEGAGLRPKIREQCDATVRLPTMGAIQSLNVSNAAAVILYAALHKNIM